MPWIDNKKTHAKTRFFTHAHSGNGWIDLNQILHVDSLGCSDIFEVASKLVLEFRRGRGVKFRLSHWLYHWLLTLRIALLRIRVTTACTTVQAVMIIIVNYKAKLESVSLSCKSHRSKTANIKFLSANSTHRRYRSHLCQSLGCRTYKS